MKKLIFRTNNPCITYLFLFLQEKQILKSSKQGRPRAVCETQLHDIPVTKWWTVLGTSTERRSKHVF